MDRYVRTYDDAFRARRSSFILFHFLLFFFPLSFSPSRIREAFVDPSLSHSIRSQLKSILKLVESYAFSKKTFTITLSLSHTITLSLSFSSNFESIFFGASPSVYNITQEAIGFTRDIRLDHLYR